MPKVFLSHHSGDKKFVRELASALRAQKIDVFLDEENIAPGQNWQSQIRRAVQDSDVVVAVLTPKSLQSNVSFIELGMAWGLGKRIIPLVPRGQVVDIGSLPPTLQGLQLLDVQSKSATEVATEIHGHMKKAG